MNWKPWDARVGLVALLAMLETIYHPSVRRALSSRHGSVALRAARKAERQRRHYALMHNRKGSHV